MDQHQYRRFKAADFLLDEEFIAWQRGNSEYLNCKWETWLLQDSKNRAEVEQAIEMYAGFKENPAIRKDNYQEEEAWKKLCICIRANDSSKLAKALLWKKFQPRLWLAVGSIVTLIALGILGFYFSSLQGKPEKSSARTAKYGSLK